VGINIVGLRRNGLSNETILAIKRAYKTLFRSGLLLKEAIAKIEAEKPCPEVQHMVDFCKNSPRGIIAAVRNLNKHDN
jgi:UDP-N-acetylglucosamine acyltransferase